MARTARLYVIVARERRKAVIFRRGPSKQVALISWDMGRDVFTVGQWFKGRIYERRCDLSPSGDLLVYFAANWKLSRGPGSWTAVSRPPYLTALALWPKGDAWGGGGVFESESLLALNHAAYETELAQGFSTPKHFRVTPFGEYSGRGEDGPVAVARDHRDGWRLVRNAVWQQQSRGSSNWYSAQGGEIHSKPQPGAEAGQGLALYRVLDGIYETDGPWYVLRHALVNESTGESADLGRSDWADWDRGALVFARAGRLYRLSAESARRLAVAEAVELADFRALEFVAAASPPSARRW